jgi:hypothetical protein
MLPTVKIGTILMKEWPGIPQLLGLESEPCSGELERGEGAGWIRP